MVTGDEDEVCGIPGQLVARQSANTAVCCRCRARLGRERRASQSLPSLLLGLPWTRRVQPGRGAAGVAGACSGILHV